MLTYRIYVLSCYKYPQRLFNLSSHSSIFFAYITTTQQKAQLAGFSELRDLIDSIEYFQKEFVRNTDLSSRLEWPSHRIHVVGGSSAQDVLSLNLLGIILDELNFYRKGGSGRVGDVKRAQEDYADTTHRRRSRFMHNGIDHSFSILISSATVNSSFTNKRIKEGKENSQLNQMVVDVKKWEAEAGVHEFSSENFAIFAGNDNTDPKLIEEPLDFLSICPGDATETERISKALNDPDVTIDSVHEALSYQYRERCLLIPLDFLMDFQIDLLKAIQNTAGMSIGDSGRFFTSNVLWSASCGIAPLKHPFTKDVIQITTNTPTRMEDVFIPEILFDMETKKFKRHPNAKRYIHIDQSETGDATGFSMVHFAGLRQTDAGLNLPLIEMDFAIGIENTAKPDRIDIGKILDFVLWLRREFQVVYGRVSYDRYASNFQLQILDKMMIKTELVSVDRNDAPWKMYRSLLDDKRFSQYNHPTLKEEVFNLIHDRAKQKVDHPPSGSKDIADGVVGATWTCISDIDKLTLDTTEGYKENLKLIGPYRGRNSKPLGEGSWIYADYEKSRGVKIKEIGGDLGLNVELEKHGNPHNRR